MRVVSSSGLLNLMYTPPAVLTLRIRSWLNQSVICSSTWKSSFTKSLQSIVYPINGWLSSHLLKLIFMYPGRLLERTKQTYQPLFRWSGNQWSKGRQIIQRLFTPKVKTVSLSLLLTTSKKQLFFPGSSINMVGLGVFFLKSGFQGVIEIIPSSSSGSSIAQAFICSLFSVETSDAVAWTYILELVGFQQINLADFLAMILYSVMSPSCRQDTASPEEYVIVQIACSLGFCDEIIKCRWVNDDNAKLVMQVAPAYCLGVDNSFGGITIWMFFDPEGFDLEMFTLAKSCTQTLRFPLIIWMFITISSFFVPVKVYRFYSQGSIESEIGLFSANSIQAYFDWTCISTFDGSSEVSLKSKVHLLGQGGVSKLVTLSANCMPFSSPFQNYSTHFARSQSSDLQIFLSKKGKPSSLAIFKQTY